MSNEPETNSGADPGESKEGPQSSESPPTKQTRKRGRPRGSSKKPKPHKAKAPPWVAERNAMELLEEAAQAIGLKNAEELANFVIDSGVVAMPPSDEVTDAYTLKELGTRLWGSMQEQPKDSRAAWFQGLSPIQRKAVIVTLRDQGFATQVIAQDLGVDIMEVVRTWNKHADDLGAQVVGIRLNTIAGNLQVVAERAQQGAMQKGDFSTMWRIQKEITMMLQSLGIVDRAIHKVEVTHKFDEQKQAELNAMLELEDKKRQREENVKQLDVQVLDSVPSEMKLLED